MQAQKKTTTLYVPAPATEVVPVLPRVSIITVTFNSAEFLQDCINSISAQNYPNIEYIIVDGKSTDQTMAIVRKNEARVDFWISETDKGMYDAINKGLAVATGDIVGLLNSDDVLDNNNVIQTIVDSFEQQGVDSIYGDLEFVDRNDVNKVMRIWKGQPFNRSRFRYGWMPAHPTFYIKRSLVEKYGAYENHYFSAADYEFMSRYLYLNKVSAYYIPELLVRMRMGGQSNVNLKQRLRANRRDYLAMKKNKIPFAFFVSILKPLIKVHQFVGKGFGARMF
ncbi:MAG: glycosyltransferase [Chitinophagaceae bacterium]|nr:MAG: glycosyltransferase [Chitinophagaceae bacterium]